MGRFDEKFTDEQRAGIVAAVMGDEGPALSVPRAVELAKRGQLEGLEPFEISAAYVYDLRRKEHRERAGEAAAYRTPKGQGVDRLDRIVHRMVGALDAGMRRYERKARAAARPRSQTQPPNPEDLVRMARAATEIRKAQRAAAAEAKPTRSSKPPSEEKGAVPGTPLAEMMAEHKATQGQATPDATRTTRAERAHEAPPTNSPGMSAETARAERHAHDAERPTEPNGTEQGRAEAEFRSALARLETETEASRQARFAGERPSGG